MSFLFNDVQDFHNKVLGFATEGAPHLLSWVDMQKRLKFIEEELDELQDAHNKQDIVKVADAIADLVYVALGTAHIMDLPFDKIWAAVHAANMRKLRGSTRRDMEYDAIKPYDWEGPENHIAAAIYEEM
jgi:predicted HAD superfamily Cof-like phosphohydrolase